MQRDRAAARVGQQAQRQIRQRHQRDQHDQHGDNIQQQRQSINRAARDGIHRTFGFLCGIKLACGRRSGGRHHQRSDHDRRWRGDQRRREDVPHRFRHHRAEDAGVKHHHRARDTRHAAGHHNEQFATTHLLQVRANNQRCLHHTDKHIRRRGQTHCPAHAHGLFEKGGNATHDQRQHAPVEQQRRQRTHHQNQRQRAKGEYETGGLWLLGKRRFAATQITKHERRTSQRGFFQRGKAFVEGKEKLFEQRHFQQQRRHHHHQNHTGDGDAPGHGTAIFADRPGEGE